MGEKINEVLSSATSNITALDVPSSDNLVQKLLNTLIVNTPSFDSNPNNDNNPDFFMTPEERQQTWKRSLSLVMLHGRLHLLGEHQEFLNDVNRFFFKSSSNDVANKCRQFLR